MCPFWLCYFPSFEAQGEGGPVDEFAPGRVRSACAGTGLAVRRGISLTPQSQTSPNIFIVSSRLIPATHNDVSRYTVWQADETALPLRDQF